MGTGRLIQVPEEYWKAANLIRADRKNNGTKPDEIGLIFIEELPTNSLIKRKLREVK